MNENSKVFIIEEYLSYVTRFALLNILWLFFCVVGLFIFGVFPATVAAMTIIKKKLYRGSIKNMIKVFKATFKADIIKSNVIGYLFLVGGLVLYMNYQIIKQFEGSFTIVIVIAYYILVIFYLITLTWLVPLYITFNNKLLVHIKNAFVIGVAKIHYTFAIWVSLFVLIYLSLEFPGVLPFFTFSILMLIWYKLAEPLINTLKN